MKALPERRVSCRKGFFCNNQLPSFNLSSINENVGGFRVTPGVTTIYGSPPAFFD
jgi:hypothetical protein